MQSLLGEKNNRERGFSFLELMIVLAILAVLAATITISFATFTGEQAVDKATLTIISVLNAENSLARSSRDASSQGVRIFSNQIVSFEGSYGTMNATTTLSNLVTVSTSTGIGTDIIFQNLVGNTTASGTITVSQKTDATKKEVIQVYMTGVVQKN